MALGSLDSQHRSKLKQIGGAVLHALYPNDFPFYACAMELVDSQGNTVDYFLWPINPEEIRETQPENTNVRKTIGGVNVVKNPTFNPGQITIRGNFGRNFKILVGGEQIIFAGFAFSIKNGRFNVTPPNLLENPVPQFSTFAKTGYGCIKILEAMKRKAKQLDEFQKPYSLYLYNPILGNNYQVEFRDFSPMQDNGAHNMIPAYNITLTTIAPLESLLSRKANLQSALRNISFSVLQRAANDIARNLRIV